MTARDRRWPDRLELAGRGENRNDAGRVGTQRGRQVEMSCGGNARGHSAKRARHAGRGSQRAQNAGIERHQWTEEREDQHQHPRRPEISSFDLLDGHPGKATSSG